jgi:hypothetical protein
MALLLWARPVFAAILLALVGAYVWKASKADAADEPPEAKQWTDAKRQR